MTIVSDWLTVDLGSATAVFTTRSPTGLGGNEGSLNLGLRTSEDPLIVEDRRDAVCVELGLAPAQLRSMRQEHGADVCFVDSGSQGEAICDALITTLARQPLLCVTADCVPIAIAGAASVAVVHAGWRGLASGVIAAAVGKMRDVDPTAPLRAAVGPAAGPCCYEVSFEVLEKIGSQAVSNGRMLDLASTAALQLSEVGISDPVVLRHCTICDPDKRFHSFRRDGSDAGRQGVIAWLNQ
jgi:YfiH family protein